MYRIIVAQIKIPIKKYFSYKEKLDETIVTSVNDEKNK